ncbi:hypothetical protein DY000_02042649 [Brassica cretica]|uniref:Uncharacterized protein n=1 Tax=Brassica cretica TaxID=69181 RepID=A0ABQ7B8B8_BRACR|nr:hypothetical protein DY000_02042649 [Brassica cretica]
MRSDRAVYVLGRYRSLCSDRASGRARSLRSDRARYVATENATWRPSMLRRDRARYVTTEHATWRPSTLRGDRACYVATEHATQASVRDRSLRSDRASVRARSLRCDRAVYVLGRYVATELRGELGRYVATEPLCKLAGFLKTLEYWQRDKFWDLVSRFLILCLEMLETSALGLGQDLGLLLVLEGAMTNSTYVSRFSFILIPYRFKVRDSCFVMLQGISLSPAFGKHSGLRGRINLSPERGILLYRALCGVGLPRFLSRLFEDVLYSYRSSVTSFPYMPHFTSKTQRTNFGLPFSHQVIGAVVAQLFWLCMKAVLSFIAKDVVAKGLDHDTFVLLIREIKPKKLDTEPVRSQLQGDFLLGSDQAE